MTSTDITTAGTATVGAFDGRDAAILQYLGLDPRNVAARAVVAVARTYDLDPVLKHVIVIPKGGAYITRDGLLHIAHRSGQLDGIVVEQEPTLSDDGTEWVARVSVYRKDMRHPFTYPGRYPAKGGNAQYAQEMALKAAEAHALRRAFSVTGLPVADEQRPAPGDAEQSRRVRAEDVATPAEVIEDADVVDDDQPAPAEPAFDDAEWLGGEPA